jgi:hypothetical protein
MRMPTLSEAFYLLQAERSGLRIVMKWGRLNEKLARYYEVRCIALEMLVLSRFSTQ